jgi:hypothetical protein
VVLKINKTNEMIKENEMQKDIQLLGLGNALVDIQFEVNDSEVDLFSLEKGTMTLVNKTIQKNILDYLGNRTNYKSSGGSAANTIIGFSSFGGKAAYKTMLGEDDFGRFYAKEFHNLGIVLDAKYDYDEHTGICFVLITPDSERTLVTALGATAKHGREHIDDNLIKRAEWLYVEGYKFSEGAGYEAINHSVDIAQKFETKIAVTLSDKFIIDVFRNNLDVVLEKSDLIFCNELEAKTYANTHSVNEAFNVLTSKFKNIAMTMGAEGSLVKWDDQVYEIPAYKTKAIDTTGAGDMYAAGFMYGITHANNPVKAGHLGSISASKVVSQYGARLTESHTNLRDMIFSMNF